MKMNTEPISEIINPIDLMQIKTKVEADMYTSLSEFLVDFQWFAHNYEIMYTSEFHFELYSMNYVSSF